LANMALLNMALVNATLVNMTLTNMVLAEHVVGEDGAGEHGVGELRSSSPSSPLAGRGGGTGTLRGQLASELLQRINYVSS